MTSGYNTILEDKWSAEIMDEGFTAVPNLLISKRCDMGISITEFYVIVAIEKYRWDDTKPWPSLEALSRLTGLSIRQVNRATSSLEERGLLGRVRRFGKSNLYDFSPLRDALEHYT